MAVADLAEMPSVAMGRRVRETRLLLGGRPSQGEIAARLHWTQQKFSKVERGAQERLSIDDLHALGAVLDEDPYYLFTGERPQPVSGLAAQIDRLELDHWGEAAVLAVARQEAQRVREQAIAAAQDDAFSVIADQMRAAGVDPETIAAVVTRSRAIAQGSDETLEATRA